jgi:hypothetical protein
MSYEGLGAQVYAASELGSRIQPWWNVRQITPAGEGAMVGPYPRRFARPVTGGPARPYATLFGRQIGPRGPEGDIEALGTTTESASVVPLPWKVLAGAVSAYLAYVLLIKPIKENPDEHQTQVLHRQTPWGMMRHLVIERHDGGPVRGWNTIQAIKDEALGDETWAVEVYPPTMDIVDEVNRRHLWEVPEHVVAPLNLMR